MTRISSRVGLAAAAVALIGSVVPATTAAANDGAHEPVIEGLAGPLGLAIAGNGTIYVAEAFGGKLTAISPNGQTTVLVDAPGQEIAGVAVKGQSVVFTQTLFDGAAGEEAPPLDSILATVSRRGGPSTTIASTQDYEAAVNPDAGNTYGLVDPTPECLAQIEPYFPGGTYQGVIESHPYAVATVRGGYAIADAAGNSILKVDKKGNVSTVAVLPPIEQTITQEAIDQFAADGVDVSDCLGQTFMGEPVPTDIEVGPHGYWYVSSLPGFPEQFGAGSIWRVNPRNGSVVQVATGLGGPVDIAINKHGAIFVAQLYAGEISKIRHGVIVDSVSVDSPGAVEIGQHGRVYAAVGVFGPSGSVIQVDIR